MRIFGRQPQAAGRTPDPELIAETRSLKAHCIRRSRVLPNLVSIRRSRVLPNLVKKQVIGDYYGTPSGKGGVAVNLPPIDIDLGLSFGILCSGIGLAVALRMLEALSSRVAAARTERILNSITSTQGHPRGKG